MAKYDFGGGCPCGLYKTCECGEFKVVNHTYDDRDNHYDYTKERTRKQVKNIEDRTSFIVKKRKKMNTDWDFGFSTEEEIKATNGVAELKKLIMPLLENLKKNPEMDIIKWEGKQRVKQIDDFIKKMDAIN